MFFYPNEYTLKILCWYLNWKCVRKGVSRSGVLGGHWGFLTGDIDDRVIPDVMNDVCLPQGRYPENFVFISQLEVCQELGVKKGGTWRTLRDPDRRSWWQGLSWHHEWCSFTLCNWVLRDKYALAILYSYNVYLKNIYCSLNEHWMFLRCQCHVCTIIITNVYFTFIKTILWTFHWHSRSN